MEPTFPEFRKINIEDGSLIEKYTWNYPFYSDYNFASLWGWNIENKREYSFLNNNLVVKFTDYETGEPFFSFLGTNETTKTAKTLISYSESLGLPGILKLMPEISVHDIELNEIQIHPDEANYDYVYLTSRLANLKGIQYKSKRQAADKFAKANPDSQFEVMDLSEIRTQDTIRRILSAWRMRRNQIDDLSIVNETEAIENIFKLASSKKFIVGFIINANEPSSFTIEEVVGKNYSIGHFWKTGNVSKGEYEFLGSNMARYLNSIGVIYWNWEQDLGIDTLRASKSSYRPSDFLRKFRVSSK